LDPENDALETPAPPSWFPLVRVVLDASSEMHDLRAPETVPPLSMSPLETPALLTEKKLNAFLDALWRNG
jgi:hypothetical protein